HDPSMADRIERHRARRDEHWSVVDLHASGDLVSALPARGVALLDGLGGWVASLLARGGAFSDDAASAKSATTAVMGRAHDALQDIIDAASGADLSLVVATEETGLGVVPIGAGTAAWVDLLGELNQRLVRSADLAVVVVAGRALPLGDSVPPLRREPSGPPLSVVPATGPAQHADAGTSRSAGSSDRERRAYPRLVGANPAARARPAGPTDPHGTTTQSALPSRVQNVRYDEPSTPVGNLDDLRHHGDELVRPGDADHAVNVVAKGPPSWLTDAFAGVLLEGHLMRYPGAATAEQALAALYERSPDEVVATNGAAQALWLLPPALNPRLAVCIHPLFTEAEAALHAHRVDVLRVHRDPDADFAIDPALIPEAADLVIVGNPAAASGSLAARETVLALTRPGRTVVVDEAFMDLTPGEPETLTALMHEGVIVVRSFTKSLSIPGVRCGAAITSPELARRLRRVRPPWSVNAFAVAAMTALARHPEELAARADEAAAQLADLTARLADIPGVRLWPSATNHLLAQVSDGHAVVAALRDAQIAVRPCGSFPGLTDDHLRITARDPEANTRLALALSSALQDLD
ncbi:MAG: bifunctional adenosylcobinamide kinase/adenosylcobinamide-phosphate guanylyltransferase, partial [Solirubrobacteraceae bacterium]|nr:bifunctional adenosylcobinamide kinase/adenosylcobinamide-phosphate guanylyltransferase [Solirubrobacteraceae bacterium]